MAVPAENLPQNPNAQDNLPANPENTGLPADPGLDDIADDGLEEKPLVQRFKSLTRRQQLQLIIGLAATLTIISAVFMWSTEKQ